nr:choice-of-anchor Q domain-containing protein [Rhodopirellula sp. MGV]
MTRKKRVQRTRASKRWALRRPFLEDLEQRNLLAAITVDTFSDVVDASDGFTSLREAIIESNSNGEDDTISLPAGTLTLSITGSGEDAAATGDLDITEDNALTIIGTATTTIDASGLNDRVFDIMSGASVDLSNVTLTGGIASDTAGSSASATGDGGAIFNAGSLSINQVTIDGNTAAGASGSGGGVFNAGTFSAIDSSIINNTANRAGGGIEDASNQSVTLTNVALDDNNAGVAPEATPAPGNGGGLHVTGSAEITITGGTVSGNVAGAEGGGLWNSATGTLTVDGTTIDGNSAPTGGGVFNDGGVDVTSQSFSTELVPLNNSGVSGNVTVTVDQSSPMTPTITVAVNAAGLVANQPHIQHIHGRFASDLDQTGTLASPFVGSGGVPISSRVPGPQEDTNGDGFITVGEGLAAYGNVLLNLSDPQTPAPPAGESPLENFDIASFPTAPDGTIDFEMTYSFDLSDPDQARQFNNLVPMGLREYVVHGVNTDIDVDGDGSPDGYRVTGPAAAGTLKPIGGSVTITNSTISNNSAQGDGGGFTNEGGMMTVVDSTVSGNTSGGDEPGEGGGGFANFGGTLEITDTNITANTATTGLGNGGGILNNDGGTLVVSGGTISGNSAARAGGGVENAGTATFDSVELDQNSTGINGGALHTSGPWTATFVNSTVTSNTAGAEGGGLWNSVSGTMTVSETTVTGNTASGDDADQGGGGVFNDGGLLVIGSSTIGNNIADGTSGSGGGILNLGGELTVTATTISGNTANRAGGGIEATDGSQTTLANSDLQNNVAGPVGTAAPGNGGGFHISGDGNASVTGGTVTGNSAAAEGGGLWNGAGMMMVSGTTFENNTVSGEADDNGGGALFNNGGALQLDDVTVANNTATGSRGGGAGVMNVAAGTLTIRNSSFIDNEAAGTMMGDGGGAVLSLDGIVDIADSTFTGNTALGVSGSGGGILARTGQLTLVDSTLSGNLANRAGGGIEIGSVDLLLDNVVLGGETVDDGNSVAGSTANPGNGGGLHVTFDSQVTVVGGLVANNSAVEGGGLWNSATAAMTVDGTTIRDNVATGDAADQGGGGVFNDGGQLSIENATISNNIANGTSGSGGGILNLGGMLSVNETVIGGNTANRAGGGIEVTADSATWLTDVTLGSNDTGSTGNSVSGNANPGNGGGLHISGNGVVTILGGLVAGNTAVEGGGLWNSPSGLLTLTSVSLENNSAIRGGGVFTQPSTTGATTIINSNLVNNQATGDEVTDGGGGIHNQGTLSIIASNLSGNIANGAAGSGGGIANAGELSITSSTLDQNIANRAGGGIEALDGSTTSLNGVDLTDNVAGPDGAAAPGNGGAVHVSGAGNVSIIDGLIANNVAAREGGGLWNGSGTMSVSGTRLEANVAAGDAADDGGGALFNNGGTLIITDAIIQLNQATGASGSGGGLLNLGGTVVMTDTSFSQNTANRAGGAIEVTSGSSTSLLRTNLVNNVAGPVATAAPGNGGGIHISGDGSVLVDRSNIEENSAANEGGGLWNSASGRLDLHSSTVHSNAAPVGAGVFNDEGSGTTTIVNSTIAENVASENGGGIGIAGGSVQVTSSTIAGNTANSGGGALIDSAGLLTAVNTIFGSNSAVTGADLSGSLISGGNNLIGDSTDVTVTPMASDVIDVDPLLGTLSDNGGSTLTIPLLDGSPALAAGVIAGVPVDQRGISRPQGNGTDIGAFESDLSGSSNAVPSLSISVQQTSVDEGDSGSASFTFLVTRSGNTSTALTVDYAVQGGEVNPVDAADFGGTFPAGTITFAADEITKSIELAISGDTVVEGNESLQIVLSNATGNANILVGSVLGTINDDDLDGDGDTQIIIPDQILGAQRIPGNNLPTAIVFQAQLDTTINIFPVGTVDLRETIRILDGNLQQISQVDRGVTTANLESGGLYAIVFEPQSMDRLFIVQANRNGNPFANSPTNIFASTDTDGSGETTPSDALRIINALARQGEGESVVGNGFLDVNRDGDISPLDALQVINFIGRQSATGVAEGELVLPPASAMASLVLPSVSHKGATNEVRRDNAQADFASDPSGINDEVWFDEDETWLSLADRQADFADGDTDQNDDWKLAIDATLEIASDSDLGFIR